MDKIGILDEEMFFAMDLEFWLRAIKYSVPIYQLPIVLSNFRYHDQSKSLTSQEKLIENLQSLSEKYLSDEELKIYHKSLNKYLIGFKKLTAARDTFDTNRLESILLAIKATVHDPYLLIKYFSIYRSLFYRSLFKK